MKGFLLEAMFSKVSVHFDGPNLRVVDIFLAAVFTLPGATALLECVQK
jgi:hypothetical protein